MIPLTWFDLVQVDEWWPVLEAPAEDADFSYDATADITDDAIVSLSLAVAPSGDGEVTVSRMLPLGTLITVWLSGGVPGRVYLYKLIITTQTGRVLPVNIAQVTDFVTAACPVPPPMDPGFGIPATWP